MFKSRFFRVSAIIICFFALLIFCSYQRAAVADIIALSGEDILHSEGERFLSAQDFDVSLGENARVEANALVFDSQEATTQLFAVPVDLTERQILVVSFSVQCPQENDGATLFVDLCTEGYDREEQEFTVTLKSGVNEVRQAINKGQDAPREAQLRVFTLDPGQYRVENLSVASIPVPNRGKLGMMAALQFLAVAFCILALICGITEKVRAIGEKEDKQGKSLSEIVKGNHISLLFLLILFCPLMLGAASKVTKLPMDVELQGYVDEVARPDLSVKSFADRSFQSGFSTWYESRMKPVGVLRKTHASFRYNLFHLGNRPIGKNRDVFESDYINAELCINGYGDLSQPEAYNAMAAYVQQLKTLREKLQAVGKELYVYVPSSKASFDRENIPSKYVAISSADAVNAETCYAQLLQDAGIPHLICSDIRDQLEYPSFYPTGIHWSRTFEQTVSAKIIRDLSALTGKNYRGIELGDVQTSDTPFWRDADVFNLLNVWNRPNVTFYEYTQERQSPDTFDKLRVLLQGDSFGDGFRHDVSLTYPYEDVFYINRDQFVQYPDETYLMIDSWESVPFSTLLDATDVVVLEAVMPELERCSCGFVDQLLSALDTYVPGEYIPVSCSGVDFAAFDGRFYQSQRGFYAPEDGHMWTKEACELRINDPDIETEGMQIQFSVPQQLFTHCDRVTVEMMVNGVKLFSQVYTEPWTGSVTLDCSACPGNQNLYCLEISTDSTYNPHEAGISEDDRDLSLDIFYIGSAKQ